MTFKIGQRVRCIKNHPMGATVGKKGWTGTVVIGPYAPKNRDSLFICWDIGTWSQSHTIHLFIPQSHLALLVVNPCLPERFELDNSIIEGAK
jgi:hypothetical protein